MQPPVVVEAPPRRERVKSTVDPARRAITGEAAVARQASLDQLHDDQVQQQNNQNRLLQLPRERAGDTDEERQLKRAILAKDAEIRAALAKLSDVAERLHKLIDCFTSSVVADQFVPQDSLSPSPSPSAMSSVSSMSMSTSSITTSALSPTTVNSTSASFDLHAPKRQAATSHKPTSLEAILAAARGQTPTSSMDSSNPSSTGRPKYAKLLRDLK